MAWYTRIHAKVGGVLTLCVLEQEAPSSSEVIAFVNPHTGIGERINGIKVWTEVPGQTCAPGVVCGKVVRN